jgi:hypothetical protein
MRFGELFIGHAVDWIPILAGYEPAPRMLWHGWPGMRPATTFPAAPHSGAISFLITGVQGPATGPFAGVVIAHCSPSRQGRHRKPVA